MRAGKAYLFKTSCPGNVEGYDHNYLIATNSYDFFGIAPHATANSDGLPGLGFGSNGVPAIGDVLYQYNAGQYGGLIFEDVNDPGDLWILADATAVTITEVGDEVGESIGGTVSGSVININDPTQTATITGAFCVPIVEVCGTLDTATNGGGNDDNITPSQPCSAVNLTMTSSFVNIDETASAYIFKTGCTDNIDAYSYNYIIASDSYNFWGLGPHINAKFRRPSRYWIWLYRSTRAG